MIETIWKFELENKHRQSLEMPEYAKILAVRLQYGKVVMWAKVNPENKAVARSFYTYATGQPIIPVAGKLLEYIETYHLPEVNFVGHIYEVKDY